MILDSSSLSHDGLHDLCKPLDNFTNEIMDDSVYCATKIFSECMNVEEINMRFMEILEHLELTSNGFTYEVSHSNKNQVTSIV